MSSRRAKNYSLYLAAKNFARGTKEEAQQHDIGIIDVGEDPVE